MRKIVATEAPQFRTDAIQKVAWVYAGVLVVMAVGQLFAFEKFIPLIESYDLPGGLGTARLVAGMAVVLEIFAVPFLLRMWLSPLMRICSQICSVAASLLWVFLSLIELDSRNANGGILGTVVKLTPFVQLIIAALLVFVSLYIVYGVRVKNNRK